MHDPDLPFRVYRVRPGSGEREIVASFARYTEAEVFIHCELLNWPTCGTDSERYWGADGQGGQAYYWIESAQLTASVEARGAYHG